MHLSAITTSCFVLIVSATAKPAPTQTPPTFISIVQPHQESLYRSRRCSNPSSLQSSDVENNEGNDGSVVHNTIPKPTTTVNIANHTFRSPTNEQLQTIQDRQVFHALQPSQVFCTSSNLCRHGHPQAFGFHPTKGRKLVSGLFRLSCPLLCEAIDEYEGEGGVRQMSDWLRSKDVITDRKRHDNNRHEEGWKREGYENANAAQQQIRRELAKDDMKKIVSRMGEYNANAFMGSGVAGIPPSQTYNVKCVHAHVADHLCRRSPSSNDNDNDDDNNSKAEEDGNIIGKHALQILEKRGVPINGNDVCWQQCNVNHERESSDWSYLAKKNRSGLRRRGENSRTAKFRIIE